MTVPHSGRGWKLAPALIAMEAEADRIAPRRRRSSDGSIGDRAHRSRFSHHNPDPEPGIDFVDALDISHDPDDGMDIHAHARRLVAARDPRLEEVISNRQIWTLGRAREGWRRYSGINPHTLHAHFVVRDSHRFDTSPWFSGVNPFPTRPVQLPPKTPPPPIEEDEMYQYVRRVNGPDAQVGAVWRLFGNDGRHLTREALEMDEFLMALGGRKVRVTDVTEAQFKALMHNTIDTRTGKAFAGPYGRD